MPPLQIRQWTGVRWADLDLTASTAVQPPGGGGQTSQMLLGIAADGTTNEAFTSVEAVVGPMGVRRCYSFGGTIPTSMASSPSAPDIGLRTSWLSISNVNPANITNGSNDTKLAGFATSVGTHPMMLTFNHEPENDGYTPSAFKAAFQHFYDVIKTANPLIKVGTIFMDWCFDPTSGYNPASFDPGVGYRDFFGVDTYNFYHFFNNQSQTTWVLPTDAKWGNGVNRIQRFLDYNTANGGQPVAVGEFGSPNWNTSGVAGHPPDDGVLSPVGSRKSAWIQTMLEFFEARNCIAMCYFNTDVNNDYEPSAFLQADQPTIDVWSSWTATHTGWPK
jgi:hypothetical protein